MRNASVAATNCWTLWALTRPDLPALSAPALRRPAPACRSGARIGRGAAHPADGRAIRRARSAHPRRDAGYAARPAGQLKKTVLLVTHDLDEALYLAHRIVLLERGKLIANLSPAEFLRSDNRRSRLMSAPFIAEAQFADEDRSGMSRIPVAIRKRNRHAHA